MLVTKIGAIPLVKANIRAMLHGIRCQHWLILDAFIGSASQVAEVSWAALALRVDWTGQFMCTQFQTTAACRYSEYYCYKRFSEHASSRTLIKMYTVMVKPMLDYRFKRCRWGGRAKNWSRKSVLITCCSLTCQSLTLSRKFLKLSSNLCKSHNGNFHSLGSPVHRSLNEP